MAVGSAYPFTGGLGVTVRTPETRNDATDQRQSDPHLAAQGAREGSRIP
jgi:hypothetical protein